jgi:hypothetical protein
MPTNYQSISKSILYKYKHFERFKVLSKVLDFYFRVAEIRPECESNKNFVVYKFWYLGGGYKITLLFLSFFDALFSQKKIYISLSRHKDLTNLISSSLGEQYVIDATNLKKDYYQSLSALRLRRPAKVLRYIPIFFNISN